MRGNCSPDWCEVSDDPDPTTDLGYEAIELDLIPTSASGTDQVLVLPTDEEMLADDAFVVVDQASVHDLGAMR